MSPSSAPRSTIAPGSSISSGPFDPDEIVHMAMIVDPAVLVPHRDTGFRVNVEGTLNVLEAHGPVRCRASRQLLFDRRPAGSHVRTDRREPSRAAADMGSGTGFYGAMKVASEALCFAYNQALGIEFATIRPSAVYGLGMNDFPGPIKALVEAAVRGESLHLETGGAHPRDYTHAADIASLVRGGARRAGRRGSDLLRRDRRAARDDHRRGCARSRDRARGRRSRSAMSWPRPSSRSPRCAGSFRSRTRARSSAGRQRMPLCAAGSSATSRTSARS